MPTIGIFIYFFSLSQTFSIYTTQVTIQENTTPKQLKVWAFCMTCLKMLSVISWKRLDNYFFPVWLISVPGATDDVSWLPSRGNDTNLTSNTMNNIYLMRKETTSVIIFWVQNLNIFHKWFRIVSSYIVLFSSSEEWIRHRLQILKENN